MKTRRAPWLAAASAALLLLLAACGGSGGSTTGTLAVTVSAPTGITLTPDVTVTGPTGTAPQTITALGTKSLTTAPGSYTLTAKDATGSDGYTYSAPVSTAIVQTGKTTASTVAYAVSNGKLTINISGAPTGFTPSVSITSGGTAVAGSPLSASGSLYLAPGTYTVASNTPPAGYVVLIDTPSPAVAAGQNITVNVTYSQGQGNIAVALTGVPSGVTAPQVTATQTAGGTFAKSNTGAGTISGLPIGTYTVSGVDIPPAGSNLYRFKAPAVPNVSVTNGATANATLAYAVASGALTVTVTAPTGVTPSVTVTGPSSFSRSITATTTLTDLAAGSYTIAASPVNGSTPTVTGSPATVTNGATAAASVAYGAALRTLAVTVTGYSGTQAAKLVVTATPTSGTPLTQVGTTSGVTFSNIPDVAYTLTAQVLSTVNTYATSAGVSSLAGQTSASLAVTKTNAGGWLFAMGNGQLTGSDLIQAELGDDFDNTTPLSFIANTFAPETGVNPAQIRIAFDPAKFFYIARQRNATTVCAGGSSCDRIDVYPAASYNGINSTTAFNPNATDNATNQPFTIITSYADQPAVISDLAFASNGDLWVAVKGHASLAGPPVQAAQPSGLLCYSAAALTQGKSHTIVISAPPSPNPDNKTLQIYQRYYTASDGSLTNVRALSFDAAGNLWVASNTKISRIPTSALTCKNANDTATVVDSGDTYAVDNVPETVTPNLELTLAGTPDVFSLAYDAGRNSLWATDYTAGSVFELPFSNGANATTGNATIGATYNTGIAKAAGLTVDKQGHVWVGTDGNNTGSVNELIPGTTTLTLGRTITSAVGITSIAIQTK
ncbi:MAG: hypothetical protein IVW51_12915 [Thermaceae bacterium]|nr:hypothetical protein [Thermaceae bacterium]